jgi:hypothetical protein
VIGSHAISMSWLRPTSPVEVGISLVAIVRASSLMR